MKFAHLADCHIGAWKDQKLRDVNLRSFLKAINICKEKKVDFILISGDLFNTSIPSIDSLKAAVRILNSLKEKEIPVYIIPGSHDFSPSGKTILDVLEEAQLIKNVFKGKTINKKLYLEFTIDKKTGAKITGIPGKMGMLDKYYYKALDKTPLESESGYKIFMFHTAITEYKPKNLEMMDSSPSSSLPKNFDYYAGGHIHFVFEKNEKNNSLVYPGPIFPNNFREIEELGCGSFYIVDNGIPQLHKIQIHPTISIKIDAENKTPEQIESKILEVIKEKDVKNSIITIRILGCLKAGKPSDINFKSIFAELYLRSAYFVMKSTSQLSSKDFKEIKIQSNSTIGIETSVIAEHIGQTGNFTQKKEKELMKSLLTLLNKEKEEGERVVDFEARLSSESLKELEINDLF